jgi:hypothetical protein
MARLARALLLVAVTFCLVAPSASAQTSLGGTLGDLWTTALETPTPDNPFGGGGPQCVVLGGQYRCAVRRWFVYVHRQGRYEDFHRRVDNGVQHL